ncbi:unnamed protein product [Adineta ricciae]|uniref:Uncharacterized protein n=1 Tax=Adineta ricciae TaxID=249248 RepID=A0A814PPB6_ADIRI|nr:unnamed protein product [Adineta ricciae]CAF1313737.1 unnamed protein product [Adineta ricciae]
MSSNDWTLLVLLSSSIEQCQSIEFLPLTSTNEYTVYCCCEETIYLCVNILELKAIVNLCYSYLFSKTHQESSQLNVLTRVLLCCITECLTSWNIRRRLVLSKAIEISKELQFVEVLLRLKPKSEQVFRYRRWLLNHEDQDKVHLTNEFNLCNQTAEKHFINYASWLHRRWLMEHFKVDIDEELERNYRWLERNISDSSGFSFRAYLISKKVIDMNLIKQELNDNGNLLKFYVDRESLWIYRQTLILLALNHFSPDQKRLLFTEELELEKQFPGNFFSKRYFRFLNVLSSSDGKQYRN